MATLEVCIDFKSKHQSFEALQEAAYRITDRASSLFEDTDDGYRLRLYAKPRSTQSADQLRDDFLNLVADENIREIVNRRTAASRQLILALAFGGLAGDSADR